MGSHTDYNDGFVLTLAIDRDTWIAAAPRRDDRVRVGSLDVSGPCEFSTTSVGVEPLEGWARYPQAVAHVLATAGFSLHGCDALVHGTLPLASGLGSSASLEAAVAFLFATLGTYTIDPLLMARLCQRAENEIVGVGCGILDQYSAILGERGAALLLDCRHLTHGPVPIPDAVVPVVCDTRTRRELAGSAYGERRASCEAGARTLASRRPGVRALRDVDAADLARAAPELAPAVERRCRFVVEENARVHALADALRTADRAAIASLCRASYEGARDLFEVGTPAMDAMIAAMRAAPGLIGARQAGAGFGGCMVALVEAGRLDGFVDAAAATYERATGIAPDIFAVRAAPGAGRLEEI
jgi:galactokinase